LSHEEVRRCCANNCEPFDAPGRRRQDWVPKRVEDILHELVVMVRSMMLLRVPKELIIGNLMKLLEGTKEEEHFMDEQGELRMSAFNSWYHLWLKAYDLNSEHTKPLEV
jgi:hypothetical protein